MVSKNSFHKGMNRDLSFSKIGPEYYYNARNIRIITREGESTGSITNEKGNELLLQIPNIEAYDSIPAQINLQIIGSTTIRDVIVLFTTNESSSTPINSYGQIWTLTYNDDYAPSLRLMYNNICNFSTNYPIKAIGNYENDNVQKVYWTDDYNQLRSFNISSNGDYINTGSYTIDNTVVVNRNIIDMAPDWNFKSITIDSVENAGVFTAGTVMYAYSQYNRYYSQTKISPPTDIIPINNQDSVKMGGNFVGKSVNISIDLDSNFDRVKVFRIQFTTNEALPSIYEIYNNDYESTSFTLTDTGITTYPTISLEEFLLLGGEEWIVKDFVQKDNRLFIGNILENNFDVDYDARAYRFASNQIANLYNIDNSLEYSISGSAPSTTVGIYTSWNDIPVTADVISPVNYMTADSSKPGGSSNYNKTSVYQTDGSTVGGEGPNVSYTFGIDTKQIDSDASVASRLQTTEENSNINYARYTLRGYARDEIYRFGIIFYNKKGRKSPVKWIGDIRFPDYYQYYDSDGGNRVPGATSTTSQIVSSKILYINFTLSNLPSDAYGYQIVRQERGFNDKTVIANAVYNATYLSRDMEDGEPADEQVVMPAPLFVPTSVNADALILSSARKLEYLDSSSLTYANASISRQYIPHYGCLYSPDLQQSTFLPNKDSDYIDSIGGMYFNARVSGSDTTGGLFDIENDLTNGIDPQAYFALIDKTFIYKGYQHGLPSYGSTSFPNPATFDLGASLKTPTYNSNGYVVPSYQYLSYTGLTSYPTFANYFRIKDYTWNVTSNLNTITYGGPTTLVAPTFINPNELSPLHNVIGYDVMPLVRYRRYLSSQYGGRGHQSREQATYIPVTDFKLTSTTNLNVYRGDIFISYTNMLMNYMTNTLTTANDYLQFSNKLLIPMECNIDPDADAGIKYNAWKNKYITSYSSLTELSGMEPSIIQEFPKDDSYELNKNFDTEVRYSNPKSNNESIDSFLEFKSNNFTEIEGEYGPINALSKFANEVFVLQDSAVSRLLINPTPQVIGNDNSVIQLGTGAVIQKAQYISSTSGSYNRFGVISSPSGIFYFDLLNLKLMKCDGKQVTSLSDLKGLSGYFREELRNYVESLKIDNPVKRRGVSGAYDINNMEALFTLMASEPFTVSPISSTKFNVLQSQHTDGISIGDVIDITVNGSSIYKGTVTNVDGDTVSYSSSYSFQLGDTWTVTYYVGNYYTVIFNDLIDGFTSFYDYAPSTYIYDTKNLLSTNPSNSALYIHGIGDYGSYYGNPIENSYIELVVNGGQYADFNKIFDSIEFYTQCTNSSNIDVPNETIDKLLASNSYQTTQDITLVPNSNIRKRHRNWFTHIPRQYENITQTRNRMKDNWLKLRLTKDNSNNNRIILHDIISNFRVVKY